MIHAGAFRAPWGRMLGDGTKSMPFHRSDSDPGVPCAGRSADRPAPVTPDPTGCRDGLHAGPGRGNDADGPTTPKPFGRWHLRPQAVSLVVDRWTGIDFLLVPCLWP